MPVPSDDGWDVRKTDTGSAFIRTRPPLVLPTQPPPGDELPVPLMVLDSLADDTRPMWPHSSSG